MDTIRHIALGCCVISTVAGMVRTFWPENGFAPVINAILALYIITAALQMVRGTDWQMLAEEIFTLTSTETPQSDSYEQYSQELGLDVSVQAIQTVLEQAGVDAVVERKDNICHIMLRHSADLARAESILAVSCGTLPYRITAGGGEPDGTAAS